MPTTSPVRSASSPAEPIAFARQGGLASCSEPKGHEVLSVAPETAVFEALQLMAERNVGVVLVLEAGRLVGTLAERDYARKVILKGRTSRETPVREIMSTHVLYVRPEQTVPDRGSPSGDAAASGMRPRSYCMRLFAYALFRLRPGSQSVASNKTAQGWARSSR